MCMKMHFRDSISTVRYRPYSSFSRILNELFIKFVSEVSDPRKCPYYIAADPNGPSDL